MLEAHPFVHPTESLIYTICSLLQAHRSLDGIRTKNLGGESITFILFLHKKEYR